MSEKEKAKVNIDGLAQGGDGVGRLDDGRVIFVPRSLPGDEVLVELVRNKKTFARGRILNFVARSKARVEPACPAFVRGCGGCRFWHTTYANELELKSDAAYEALKAALEAEGLFAPERKTSLPTLPRHIAVITSPTGAA
ncbi:MAG: TRAM domain-containing protein, partial [Bradymonadaceae bacterium]